MARSPKARAGRCLESLSGRATFGRGTTNATFKVQTGQGVFVVRLHEPLTVDMGVDRVREATLHRIAAEAGIASGILAADPQGRYLVTEFLEGSPWREADFDDAQHLQRLLAVLARLHSLPAPQVPALDLEVLLDRHVACLSAEDPLAATVWSADVARARDILGRQGEASRTACIVHGDPTHTNLIGNQPHLIDWEYAAVGDPLGDIACLAAYYPQLLRDGEGLLQHCGLTGYASLGDLTELTSVYRLLSNLWYRRVALAGRHPPPAH